MAGRIARTAVAAVCTVACVLSVAACGADDEAGKIRIGIKFDQPGLGFKKSGTYVGFDVDVAKYIAKSLGYSEDQIIWKEAPSKQREAMIQNGDVDMILATYSITDDRKRVVSFAGPYFVAGQDLLVRKGETGINGPQDLNGKRLCSVTGSTSAVTVKERFASKVQLMEQPGYAECATALLSGIVDAVTTDDIILAGLASASRGRLRVIGKPFTVERYGVGIKKGDTKLASQINNAITQMIQDGSWKRAIDDNTKGVVYTPNAKYNPPTPTEGEKQ
jgi:glutamate transport system substrate-binding protein